MKQEKHLIQCLFCEKYLGWNINKPKKRTLAVCNGICLENLTKHLDQELNKRAETKAKSWKKKKKKNKKK